MGLVIMEKLTVADAASKLGISKEAIYNRIRRNTMKSAEENGVRYVFLEEEKEPQKRRQTNTNTNELVEYLKSEIEYLKLKNSALEQDKDKLFREKEDLYKQKEEILISSKDEIKAMYVERDKKLKYFLSLLERPLIEETETDKVESEAIDVKTSKEETKDDDEIVWLDLKEFLDSLDLKKKERREIKKLIAENAYEHHDIKIKAGMLYVNRNIDIESLNEENE